MDSLMQRAIARALTTGAKNDRDCEHIVRELIAENEPKPTKRMGN